MLQAFNSPGIAIPPHTSSYHTTEASADLRRQHWSIAGRASQSNSLSYEQLHTAAMALQIVTWVRR